MTLTIFAQSMPSEPNTGDEEQEKRQSKAALQLESTAFVAFLVFKLCVVEIIVEEEGGVRRERGLESRLLIKWSKQEKWS